MVRDYGPSCQSVFEEEDFEHLCQREKRKRCWARKAECILFFCRWSQASEREGREGETHLGYRAGLKSLILSGSNFSQLLNKAPEKTVLSLGGGKGKFIRLNAQDDLKGLSCACPEAFHRGSPSRRRE